MDSTKTELPMYLFENPVLQRELLVNLRTPRAFVLLLLYQVLLAGLVYFAWPKDDLAIDLSKTGSTSTLVDLFFLGQYILASLMAPSFAAGAIAGEKERATYEMLLASPIRPEAIVMGKLVAALTHLAILIFASLPIVLLCLPLGGVSPYEVLAAYLALIASVITFGMISVACGSFFPRTSSALVVSYLTILPMALCGILFWYSLSDLGVTRIKLAIVVIPGIATAITISLFYICCARMLYPPDFGSEGKEVVDLEQESAQAVGLVIQRDQFPDRLFAPPKRDTLMEDGTNPVYDKEMRSEIFGQGTLMLRLAIQISMLVAIPVMAWCLYIQRHYAPWYISYVILFNILIGPVFSAGSVTGERERQTLDLLLTTIITPWEILWGKLLSGLRVSSVLSSFLLWPVFLALVMVSEYWSNTPTIIAYLVIFALTCLTTAMLALCCSTLFSRTSRSLMATYTVILLLYVAPLAASFFGNTYFPRTRGTEIVDSLTVTSPFSAAFNVPIYMDDFTETTQGWQVAESGVANFFGYPLSDLRHFGGYVSFTILLNVVLFGLMIWMFNSRWRVAAAD
ncbi:MAG: ABC-type transport system involved in multi-copper enzyme maturation permease subunit [Mariniblastus sp.]|jgi:ABC-type transport system involved in multi-copper enzyme maturation permease subunit